MKKLGYIGAALALPFLASAQGTINATNAQSLSLGIIDFINQIAVPLIFALAFIVFIWGVFLFFIAGGHDEEKKEKGKSLMFYGLIGFFVMISVWGLVNILSGTFSFSNDDGPVRGLPDTPRNNI